jgi:hypothetical protein
MRETLDGLIDECSATGDKGQAEGLLVASGAQSGSRWARSL